MKVTPEYEDAKAVNQENCRTSTKSGKVGGGCPGLFWAGNPAPQLQAIVF
jgi:hypothetical protein